MDIKEIALVNGMRQLFIPHLNSISSYLPEGARNWLELSGNFIPNSNSKKDYFEITIFYYNPNISPEEEYEERVSEQERLIRELNEEWSGDQSRTPVRFLSGPYEPERFYQAVKGLEKEPEGGLRCTECFSLRLEEAARMAAEGGYDFFTTTLSISPMKNAQKLNEIGVRVGAEYGVEYLVSDFKKKNGYKRSTELSQQYGLYRQDYCGCEFSLAERRRMQTEKTDIS